MKKSITKMTLSERLRLIIDVNPDRNCYEIYPFENNLKCKGEYAEDQLKRPALVKEEDYDLFLMRIYCDIEEIMDDYIRNSGIGICLWTGEYVFITSPENGYIFSNNFSYILKKWIDPMIEGLTEFKQQIRKLKNKKR